MKATTLAERLRACREEAGLSLDELATKAKISKTYLWELEKDVAGEKKPSADVLLRITAALSVTIADLLALPTVQFDKDAVQLSPSLGEFRDRMAKPRAGDPRICVADYVRMQDGEAAVFTRWPVWESFDFHMGLVKVSFVCKSFPLFDMTRANPRDCRGAGCLNPQRRSFRGLCH